MYFFCKFVIIQLGVASFRLFHIDDLGLDMYVLCNVRDCVKPLLFGL